MYQSFKAPNPDFSQLFNALSPTEDANKLFFVVIAATHIVRAKALLN